MFYYNTNVKTRTTYEIGVNCGKPDYTNVVKYSTARFQKFEIDEILSKTGDRIIYVYDEESLRLKEYRRYLEKNFKVPVEKARDIEFSPDKDDSKNYYLSNIVIEQPGVFFEKYADGYWYGALKERKEFRFSEYVHYRTCKFVRYEFDNNDTVLREFYYNTDDEELYKVLEHQYDLIESEGEDVDDHQTKLISLITRMDRINQLMLTQDELAFLKSQLR